MYKYLFTSLLLLLLSIAATAQLYRPAEPCSGIPAAGIAASNLAIACQFDSLRLTVTGTSTQDGLAYQWQSSEDSSTWVNIPGGAATNASCTVLQDSTRFYRRSTSCSGNTAFSVPVKVGKAPCYCKPLASYCNAGDYIMSVSIGNFVNRSFCSPNGYTDYSGSTAVINIQPPGIGVYAGISSSSGTSDYVSLWIDFDHDGTFSASEYYYIGSTSGINGFIGRGINLPLTSPGLTKMRIRLNANSQLTSTEACTSIAFGETEDYLVNILPYIFCSGKPQLDTAYSNVASTCNNSDSVYLYTTPQNTGYNNFTYQWEKSADSINWQNSFSTGAIGFDYVNSTTFFRRRISCGDSSNYSVPVKVTQLCYCKPAASICSTGVVISKVILNGTEYPSGCGYNGYTDFGRGTSTNRYDTILAGTYLSISVQAGCAGGGPQYVGAWIDLDFDGLYEANEYTPLGTACNSTVSGSLPIPANATGQPKIRVRISTDSSFNAASSCATVAYGETEDFRINILPGACPLNTWTGLGSNDYWENAANWSCGVVPGPTSAVAINSGTVTINSDVTVYSLTIGAAATLTVTLPYNLVILH
jgi:hypothetical protein